MLSGGNDNAAKNLTACTGECDSDAQCAEGLLCFQRDNGEKIPGCTGPGSAKYWDYCFDPSKSSDYTKLGGSDNDTAKNLTACTGECDADSQCARGLQCFQRQRGEPIPGCWGKGGGPDWDYCYNPTRKRSLTI